MYVYNTLWYISWTSHNEVLFRHNSYCVLTDTRCIS